MFVSRLDRFRLLFRSIFCCRLTLQRRCQFWGTLALISCISFDKPHNWLIMNLSYSDFISTMIIASLDGRDNFWLDFFPCHFWKHELREPFGTVTKNTWFYPFLFVYQRANAIIFIFVGDQNPGFLLIVNFPTPCFFDKVIELFQITFIRFQKIIHL